MYFHDPQQIQWGHWDLSWRRKQETCFGLHSLEVIAMRVWTRLTGDAYSDMKGCPHITWQGIIKQCFAFVVVCECSSALTITWLVWSTSAVTLPGSTWYQIVVNWTVALIISAQLQKSCRWKLNLRMPLVICYIVKSSVQWGCAWLMYFLRKIWKFYMPKIPNY